MDLWAPISLLALENWLLPKGAWNVDTEGELKPSELLGSMTEMKPPAEHGVGVAGQSWGRLLSAPGRPSQPCFPP